MSKRLYACVIAAIILGGLGFVITISLVNGHKLTEQENTRAIIGIIMIALSASCCMLGTKVIDSESKKQKEIPK